MDSARTKEILMNLVQLSSLFATISFDGLIERLPEFEQRINQIDISYYNFLFMTGCIYSGIWHLKKKNSPEIPDRLFNTVFDSEIISSNIGKTQQFGTVGETIDARYDRWFTDGSRAVKDLEMFIDRSKKVVDNMEDNVNTFLIGQWFLWNLFGEQPNWASIKTCSVFGGSMFYSGAKIVEDFS